MAVHAGADGHNTRGITGVHLMLHSSDGVNTSSVLQLGGCFYVKNNSSAFSKSAIEHGIYRIFHDILVVFDNSSKRYNKEHRFSEYLGFSTDNF